MERFEQIKIYGQINETEREDYKKELIKIFEEQEHLALPPEDRKKLLEAEIEKPPEVVKFIEIANEKLESYFKELNLKFYPVPLKNIHIIPTEVIGKTLAKHYNYPVSWFTAIYDSENQGIYCKDSALKDKKLNVSHILLHEMIHMSASESFFIDSKSKKLSSHRDGFYLKSSKDEKKYWFYDINEALTEKITGEIVKRFPDEEAERYNLSGINGHSREMELLDYIMQEIYEDNKNRFSSPEEVFQVFSGAYFSSRLLEPIRLMKKSFGKKGLKYIRNSGSIFAKGPTLSFDVLRKLKKIRAFKKFKQRIRPKY